MADQSVMDEKTPAKGAHSSEPPALWPQLESNDIVVAPVFNSSFWFAVVKEQVPGTLTKTQIANLHAIGFKSGSAGRLIYPKRADHDLAVSLGRILNAPLDLLTSEQVIFLQPPSVTKPAVPLEVQAGIRWFWKNQPQLLLIEIQTSLENRQDELSAQTLHATQNNRLYNLQRIQRWVAQALAGELSAVTEPIIGLGLRKAGQNYRHQNNWPPELREWADKLADERGESRPEALELSDGLQLADSLVPDYRPAIGAQINWTVNGQRGKGVVVDHDPDAIDVLWISSSELLQTINGVYFPSRQRITVDKIDGLAIPEPAPKQQVDDAPVAPAAQSDVLRPQEPLTLKEIASFYDEMRPNDVELSDHDMHLLESSYRLGQLSGVSPLAPSKRTDPMIDYWFGETRDIASRDYYGEHEVQATILIRDLILSDFNRAQPQTAALNRPLLAVYPLLAIGTAARENRLTAEELTPVQQQEFCTVGIHPTHTPAVRDALINWSMDLDKQKNNKGISSELAHSLTVAASRMRDNSLSSSGLLAPPADVYRIARAIINEQEPARAPRRTAEQSLARLEEHKEGFLKAAGYSVFESYEAAGSWVNGATPKVNELAAKNQRILQAVSEIADRSTHDIEGSLHPVFAVIDELHAQGLPKCSRAQALAMLNYDLSDRMAFVGQLAALNGASIALSHNETPETEVSEKLQHLVDSAYKKVEWANVTTGWLETDTQRRPFQVAIMASGKDLNLRENTLGMRREPGRPTLSPLFRQADFGADRAGLSEDAFVGLGRLVALHSEHGIEFAEPMKDDVITAEATDKVPLNIFIVRTLGDLDTVSNIAFGTLKSDALSKPTELPSHGSGDISPDTMVSFCQAQRSALLTLTPSWRNDRQAKDQMQEAVRLWIDDQKHFKDLKSPENIQRLIMDTLVDPFDTEMVLVATKVTRGKVYPNFTPISQKDVLIANNNREQAVEREILRLKSGNNDYMTGWQFSVFDAATVMRPQALRMLNEYREQLRIKHNNEHANQDVPESGKEMKSRRGKRQDKGVVAGLSIKDLRGKTSAVLGNLMFASSADQAKYITKVKLWEAPDWTNLREPDDEAKAAGERAMEPIVASFFDIARKALTGQPPANIREVNQAYAKLVLGFRDAMDGIRTEAELLDSIGEGGALHNTMSTAKTAFDNVGFDGRKLVNTFFTMTDVFKVWHREALSQTKKNSIWGVKSSAGKGAGNVSSTDDTGAMPMLTALVRKGGEDFRGDASVDEQTVIATFGFSGIEYGNSMTQNDRTEYLNQAYDGFMDLSKVLGVPPAAMSLGGSLGLAFGSRGRGGRNAALAHFEPSNNVINLTRMKGAGSAAHEYGHALANYFYRLSRGIPGSRSEGDITESINLQLKRGGVDPEILAGNLRNPVAEAIGVIMQSIKYSLPKKEDGQPYTLSEAAELQAYPSPLVRGAARADLIRGAARADGGYRKKPYWNTPEELFARSFETWVHTGLTKLYPDFQNDFLVRKDKLEQWGSAIADTENAEHLKGRAQIYPHGDQLDNLHQAFKGLFKTIKYKDIEVTHDHLGKTTLPILYSHNTGSIEPVSQREHEIIAECVMNEVARMCGDKVWVQWAQELTDKSGKAVAGQYRDLPSSEVERNIRGVIDLAYGVPMGTAYHEAFHFAQSALITETEQMMLDRAYSHGSPLLDDLCESLHKDAKTDLILHCMENPREAQAYAYEQWVTGKLNVDAHQKPATTFGRVKKFLSEIFNIGKQASFKTPDQLFRAFYSGQLASDALKQNQAPTVSEAQRKPMMEPLNNAFNEQSAHTTTTWIELADLDDQELPACR